ncbi:unnamed protein product [Rotaria socialis]|uniref:C3H1-type domain-containing protein n=1 Tax=Rotaria socialis TaxID=392032 RepID=A0A818HGL5_9BILA|nr:unnamed protein product [Rotaria socialis]CAF4870049.1 unnamed protein product [Rotaria socialis]
MAAVDNEKLSILELTDCIYFLRGHCMFNGKCHYRHCQAAIQQLEQCFKWPGSCRDKNCPYRHTGKPSKMLKSSVQEKDFISFFWDIENVPIPKGQKPFDIVQRIRQKLVVESGLQEADFSCFCNINTISQDNQHNLHHANVRIVHVPDRKSGAVDRQIMLELDRFERIHRPPATVVLISGDIDFVGKLSDLRHQAGFHVIVIHNKPAKDELKATVHTHYPWEYFTESNGQHEIIMEDKSKRSGSQRRNLNSNFNDQTNNNSHFDHKIPVPKPRQSRSKTRVNLQNETNIVQNNNVPQNFPVMYPRATSTNRNYKRMDYSPSRKPQNWRYYNAMPYFYSDSYAPPPSVPNPIATTRARKRQSASVFSSNRQNNRMFTSSEQISPTINNDLGQTEQKLLSCAHCNNRYGTIQALRQHQKDRKHLFFCPVCCCSFTEPNNLKQHQTAKGHDISTKISHQDTTNDTSNKMCQLADSVEHKLDVSNTTKILSENHQTSTVNNSAIDKNTNNVDIDVS